MNKFPKYLLAILAVTVGLFLVWRFSNIVAYVLVSAVLAVMGQPLVDFFVNLRIRRFRFRIPRWGAALLTLCIMWALALTFFALFIPLIFDKVNELANLDVQHVIDNFKVPLARFEQFLFDYFSINASDLSLSEGVSKAMSRVFNLDAVNNLVSSIVSVVADTVIALFSITFITFFFLKDNSLFTNIILTIFPSRYEQNIRHALSSVTTLLSRYFVGILAESFIMMMIVAILLMIFGFGISNAFFIGIVVGVLNVIPYVGPWIGFGISAVMGAAFVVDGLSVGTIVALIAATILTAQMIDNFVLQPVLYSRQVKAHPLEIFIVILVAGSIGGVVGMLLAIPAYTVLRVFAKEFFNNFKIVRKLTENI